LEQIKWKARFVGDALRRIGKLEIPDPEIVPSPQEVRYRNRVTFTLRRLPGDKVVAGFRERLQKGRVLDLGSECLLPEEPLSELWRELRAGWGHNARLLPGGRELRLNLRTGELGGGLTIKGGQGNGDPQQLLSQVEGLSSIWREGREGDLRHLAGEPELPVLWAGEEIRLGGAGFTQVNPGAGELLYAYVLSQTSTLKNAKIIDAYCGIGVLGRAMARLGNEVLGIDIHPISNGAELGEGSFRVLKGRVETELPRALPADLVLLNPPRTGVDPAVCSVLADRPVSRVIYVSCDPGTLARDLERMKTGYTIRGLRSFDLFPQTEHVETVVFLEGPTG
jgi:23S rRNA (uracil1939-C5)-methyltransferase